MSIILHLEIYSRYCIGQKISCWAILFKFGLNIPFYDSYDKHVGKKYTLVFPSHLEDKLWFWESQGVL